MTLPYLSSYHTLENSQGTLDPLGLYTIADRLALRLVPGFRERMSHPRYLTAIAVGAVICSAFQEDELAVDEVSPPWQVYEWYVTSAFVKRFDKVEPSQLIGMPAREKTTRALREGFPMTAPRYLKTPSVFGFHGVYRTLARSIKLLDGNQIGEFGVLLVDTWEKEQSLEGFRVGKKGSSGYEFRSKMEEAVRNGLKAGAVAKSWSWDFFTTLADSLVPKSPGKGEAAIIYEELLKGETASRAELIRFLMTPEGQSLIDSGSEKAIHTALLQTNPSNKELLLAIQAYEKACRLLYNSFYEILQYMSNKKGRVAISTLGELSAVKEACSQLPIAFLAIDKCFEPFATELILFTENFQPLRETYEPEEWVRILLEHHFRIQKNKPPSGKAPWVLEYTKDEYLLNTSQFIEVSLTDEYVHQYRTKSIQSFLIDLAKI